MVIFGAGVKGQNLHWLTGSYNCPWKCFIDSKPEMERLRGLPVIAYDRFIQNYEAEDIFISSRIYNKEMYNQLLSDGIPKERIVNAGELLEQLFVKQYFDLEYLKPTAEREVFADVGAYDGMSAVYFNKWAPKGSFSICFEPDSRKQKECVSNLKQNNVLYKMIPKGAWNQTTSLHFSQRSQGSSRISESGEEIVEVTTLDEALQGENVTYVKMDIEGAEYEALIGAKKIITERHPKLAICVYHKPEDIWELPEIILDYNPNYDLYLRHYSFGNAETVLYAIDRSEVKPKSVLEK